MTFRSLNTFRHFLFREEEAWVFESKREAFEEEVEEEEYAESLGSGSASVWMEGPWDGNGGQLGGWDIAGIRKREMGEGYCKIWCTGSCLRLGWTSGPGRFGGILAGLGNTSYLGDAELSYC